MQRFVYHPFLGFQQQSPTKQPVPVEVPQHAFLEASAPDLSLYVQNQLPWKTRHKLFDRRWGLATNENANANANENENENENEVGHKKRLRHTASLFGCFVCLFRNQGLAGFDPNGSRLTRRFPQDASDSLVGFDQCKILHRHPCTTHITLHRPLYYLRVHSNIVHQPNHLRIMSMFL